ncbi:hypothetical protein FHT80_002177 [Rhizobium sp. BK226]|uniref:hypothetical protein n=1 Tax=Rhizobium TaxID=379 RepID=UPI0016194AE2|nr:MULTISPECIES: hypothetical protein [Rhizobium]MBB3300947.1 hypothetical protein [Rhizobium sp. BK112]MBB3368570.1 hypothetical protein [Rhizobium sp. BK077]MBB4112855.1 hypothetical protein [Rhizobium sp. BK226]MBB4180837.1 hypothetical protein [Rhizobium sp. BK109]UTS89506.1 hypothetical protein NE851_23200 [Rhizobium anhuiense bv. trifolii]
MLYDPPITITTEIAQRLISLEGKRLAVPVAPLPGEGLADVAFRSASINGLSTTNRMLGREAKAFSHQLAALATFEISAIADLIGTPNGAADLVPISYPRVKGPNESDEGAALHRNESSHYSFFGSRVTAKQLISNRRVSPRSLRESPHSRAIWHLAPLNFDPTTLEMLLDHCPVCLAALDFLNSRGVCFCHKCGSRGDLRNHPQPIVSVPHEDALRFLAGLLDPCHPESKVTLSNLHPDISKEEPGSIFFLGSLIANVLDGNVQPNALARRYYLAAQAASPTNLALAARALLDWPYGFEKLLPELERRLPFSRPSLNGHPFVILFGQSRLVSKSLLKVCANAAKSTDVKRIAGLAFGGVEGGSPKDGKAPAIFNSSAEYELLNLAVRSKEVFALKCVTGLPVGILLNCFRYGALRCPEVGLASAFVHSSIGQTEMASFLKSVPKTKSKASLPVKSFVSVMFRLLGCPWPPVIRKLLEGELPVVKHSSGGTWIDALHVIDFENWKAILSQILPSTKVVNVLTWNDVAFYLDKSRTSAFANTRHHFLNHERPTMEELASFRAKYISIREIAGRFRIGGVKMPEQRILWELKRAAIHSPPGRDGFGLRTEVESFYGQSISIS